MTAAARGRRGVRWEPRDLLPHVRRFDGGIAGPASRYVAIAQDVWSTWRAAVADEA